MVWSKCIVGRRRRLRRVEGNPWDSIGSDFISSLSSFVFLPIDFSFFFPFSFPPAFSFLPWGEGFL